MKFDAIVMNPHYGRLAPKILKGLVEAKVADHIVTIQPLYQFTTIKPQGDKNRTLKDGTDLSAKVELVIVKSGSHIWKEIEVLYTLGIIKVSNNDTNLITVKYDHFNFYDSKNLIEFKNLKEVPQNGYHPIQQSIWNKVINHDNLNTNIEDFKFYIPKKNIGGGVHCKTVKRSNRVFKQYGLLVSPSSEIKDRNGDVVSNFNISKVRSTGNAHKNFLEKPYARFEFKTLIEAEHARQYLLSSFVRFCASKTIVDVNIDNIDIKQVPSFDFTTPVPNERIQKEFNLTDQEMEFIDDFGRQLNGEKIDWSKYDWFN